MSLLFKKVYLFENVEFKIGRMKFLNKKFVKSEPRNYGRIFILRDANVYIKDDTSCVKLKKGMFLEGEIEFIVLTSEIKMCDFKLFDFCSDFNFSFENIHNILEELNEVEEDPLVLLERLLLLEKKNKEN